MIYFLIYILIGIIITETVAQNDTDYAERVYSSVQEYIVEVFMWLPDLFNFHNDDNENLGY